MPAVGAHGQGTVTRRADGRFQVSVTMTGGRRIYRYARTPREAERVRRQLVEAREADLDPTRQTLAVFLRSWIGGLRDAKRQRVRPRTLDHYAMIVERHIIPALGSLPLERLTRRRIQAWLDADPASPRTIRHHHAVLRRALNTAVGDTLTRNPAIGVELAEADYDGSLPLTVDEARRLFAATVDDRLHALWRLAVDTGLREAELLGLGWDDVDLDAGTVTVISQLQRLDGEWVRTPTKAARSLDELSIAGPTVAALRAHKLAQADERRDDWRYFGLVFVTPKGEPYHAADALRRFHAACDAAGIPRRRIHDLRHSSMTLMRELGIAEDVRMARVGHSTKTMARRYAHVRPGEDRVAADTLGEALG